LDEQDNVSQGQATYSFAKAIESAKKNGRYNYSKWQTFLKKACDIQSVRILKDDWNPVSTNGAFYSSNYTGRQKCLIINNMH
jgi:hypothetical protein